jgi:hypothetical protein
MTSESRSTLKLLAVVIVIASVAAVVAVLLQVLILGKSNAAVSGGVVGAVAAGVGVTVWKKKNAST